MDHISDSLTKLLDDYFLEVVNTELMNVKEHEEYQEQLTRSSTLCKKSPNL